MNRPQYDCACVRLRVGANLHKIASQVSSTLMETQQQCVMEKLSSSSECEPVRILRWPESPAVDLLIEFPWIIAKLCPTPGTLRNGELPEHDKQPDDHKSDARRKCLRGIQLSPYKQLVVSPKPYRATLSPAQRAGKKILQVKAELRLIAVADALIIPQTHDLSIIQHDAGSATVSREIPVPTANCSIDRRIKRTRSLSPTKTRGQDASVIKHLHSTSPVGKTRACKGVSMPTQAEIDMMGKQKRLALWLLNNTAQEFTGFQAQPSVNYSQEVAARVKAAVTCKNDEDGRNDSLWIDPVRSILAAEVTSESVLGGFVPTRWLAFQPHATPERALAEKSSVTGFAAKIEPPQSARSSSVESGVRDTDLLSSSPEQTVVDCAVERAREIQAHAQQLCTAGCIEEAIATLDTGIHQILYEYQDNHDQLTHEGFNYSVLAHQLATKIQLRYRRRHRERVRNVMFIQRVWRRFRLALYSLSTGSYDDAHAATIQRLYKRRYQRIICIRSTVRIQNCFRVYRSQKHILHFHQACRLLLARERHRRELSQRIMQHKKRMWNKLRIVLRILRLWKMRRGSITCLQKRWKGRQCRERYSEMLNELRAIESERRQREDVYAVSHLDAAIVSYRAFLRDTRRGRELVKLHGELPWMYFRRLKRNSGEWMNLSVKERIDLLDRMYNGRRVSSWEWRVMAQELSLAQDTQYQSGNSIEISSVGLQFLLDNNTNGSNVSMPFVLNPVVDPSPRVTTLPKKTVRYISTRLSPLKERLADQTLNGRRMLAKAAMRVGWHAVYYPRAYYWHHRLLAHRTQARTRERLEDDFKRTVSIFLRKSFRDMCSDGPRFECETCFEPFATTAELHEHSSGVTATGAVCAAAKQRANAEWKILTSEVDALHHQRRCQWTVKRWTQLIHDRFCLKSHFSARRNNIQKSFNVIQSIPFREQGIGVERWNFADVALTQSTGQSLLRKAGRGTIQKLAHVILDIVGSGTRADTSVSEIPLELIGYVIQTLGGYGIDNEGNTESDCDQQCMMLLYTALFQFVAWEARRRDQVAMQLTLSPGEDRPPIIYRERITVQELYSLFTFHPASSHQSRTSRITGLAKSKLARCRKTLQALVQRVRRRQHAYWQRASPSGLASDNDSTKRSISSILRRKSALRQPERGTVLGSVHATTSNAILPSMDS